MENYENKALLKEAAKQSLESLKDLQPGTEEYTNTANTALKLYDMQLKSEAQESDQNLKEEEGKRKDQELINEQDKVKKSRWLDIARLGLNGVMFVGTVALTIYGSVCEAGGVVSLSRAMNEGLHEIKRGFTEKK